MYFLVEDDDLLKNIIIFSIKSALILKKNLVATLSTTKKRFQNQSKFVLWWSHRFLQQRNV